jgi:hypothetical protein
MPPDTRFLDRLQSHVGGLIRVRVGAWRGSGSTTREFDGKIGLLMSTFPAFGGELSVDAQWVELLIDESIKNIFLYPDEVEFIGADDA